MPNFTDNFSTIVGFYVQGTEFKETPDTNTIIDQRFYGPENNEKFLCDILSGESTKGNVCE